MRSILTLTLLVFVFAACSSESTEPEPNQPDTVVNLDEGLTDDIPVVVENCDDVDGKVYRMNTLNVIKPSDDEGVMSGLINALWSNDIETDFLNLIFAVDTYDSETGALVFSGGGAVATDGKGVKSGEEGFDSSTVTYALAPELTFLFHTQVDGCTLASTETSKIVLLSAKVSVVESEDCADVPGIAIDQIEMLGGLDSNGSGMSNGVLNGVLREHVADCLEAKGLFGAPDNAVNFGWFVMVAGGVLPDHDHDGDGENDSWIFESGFTAVPIDNFVPAQ